MADPRGLLTLKAGGKEYRLHLGMSVLADLQTAHGTDVMRKLQAPEGAGADWVPDLNIVIDLFRLSLRRYHEAEAEDRYLVDDLMAENAGAFAELMAAAFPEPKAVEGNGKRPKRAA